MSPVPRTMYSMDTHLLTPAEYAYFKQHNTPWKIQDTLDIIPINFEHDRDTHLSPRMVISENRAHCIEGAALAAALLWFHGHRPLLLDFTTKEKDEDHVVALYKYKGHWGALSKTNHPILRYRDPIYRSVRELAMSYVHEYFMFENGEKTLVSYSRPLSLAQYGASWVTAQEDLWWLDEKLDALPHYPVIPKGAARILRPATSYEIKALSTREWKHRQ